MAHNGSSAPLPSLRHSHGGIEVPDPLVATKVTLPRLRRPCVPRRALLRRLHAGLQAGHLLSLISAPAGYGKTTTLRLWLDELDRPAAWLRLDPGDNDLPRFLTYLAAALQRSVDGLGRTAWEGGAAARELDPARVASLLANELQALEQPVVLVLEDYHQIDNPQIDGLLTALLRHALPTLHLAITTREDPALPVAHLRAHNQLTEVRAADLRFAPEEAAAFLTQVMALPLPEPQVALLTQRTEGWAAGLQLAALSLQESHDPDALIRAFGGAHRHVLDYLLEEVLNAQSEEVRRFLRQTAILEQLCADLCQAVSGQPESRRRLRELERRNLFLLPLDDHRTWYRYHALFADLLRSQLLQSEPELWDELHARAAAWYRDHGYIHQAVEHAFQCARPDLALHLLEAHAFPLLFQGEVTTVAAWFERLPEESLQQSPMLCIGKAWAWVLMQRGPRTGEVARALRAAEQALERVQAAAPLRRLVAGHSASIQAFLLQAPAVGGERPEKLLATSQEAQRLLPEDEKAIRSVNALNIGYAYTALADLPAAEQAYAQALEDGVAGGNWYAAIYGPIDLVALAMLKGRLSEALQMCEENLDRFNRLMAGQRFPPIGDLYSLKGSILLEKNQLAEAEQALLQGVSLLPWTGEYEAQLRGYAALARLRAAQGDRVGMLESLKCLEESRPEVAVLAQAVRHRWSVQAWAAHKESLEEARLWLAQAAMRFAGLPDITGVDPVSRMHFQAYLCAAHILTRLARPPAHAAAWLDAHAYLARQAAFAAAHGLVGWQMEIRVVRALMYHAAGAAQDALGMIQAALRAAAPRGYVRLFLDERDRMRPLLEFAAPHLADPDLAVFARRLLDAMAGSAVPAQTAAGDAERLSERELEVLALLAAGLAYKEIGEQLFLSLNTVQFHVKNIYGKLQVNKRVQAIQKARDLKLI